VVLITGAATGIGRAVAVGFASRGAKVAIGDINEAAAAETLDLIKRAGGDVLFVRTNVAEEADVQKLVSATVERFGRLDWAFNNAGIVHAPQSIAQPDASVFARRRRAVRGTARFNDPARNKGCRGARHRRDGGRDRQCDLSRDGHAVPLVADLDRKGARTRVGDQEMSMTKTASNTTAPTQFLRGRNETYAYRRFGSGPGRPLLFLQHFTGTLDNWDPAVTDPLAREREVILFDSAGVGRSSGKVPVTVGGMASHALNFLDGLELDSCDVLGFSLGGMVAQQMARDRPPMFRRMILVGTAPRGGEDIMHLEKPSLARHLGDPTLKGYAVLQKIFFAPTSSSQTAGGAFIERLAQRTEDLDAAAGPDVVAAQMAAFREWEQSTGIRFAELKGIHQPTLVVNGIHDEMIPVSNSYRLSENLPNAVLLAYPDSGHGSLFQFHESFTRQAAAFLASDSPFAPY